MAKPGPKHESYEEREAHIMEVGRLARFGYSQVAIAKRLGVSQAQVSRDLAEVRNRYVAVAISDRDALVREQSQAYLEIMREAIDAWEKSKGEARRHTRKTITVGTADGPYAREEESEEVAWQAGDPRFLQVIAECRKALRELHGLDAPKRVEVSAKPTLPWDDLAGKAEGITDEVEAVIEAARTPSGKRVNGKIIDARDTHAREGENGQGRNGEGKDHA